MDEDEKTPDPSQAMRISLMGLIEGMEAFTEAVVGFRAQLEAAGYSPTMAEAIAGELHRQLIISGFTALREKS